MPALLGTGLSPATVALSLAIIFGAALAKAMLGFGEGLLAMPLLTLLLGIRAASPLVGLVSAGLTLVMLLGHRQSVDLKSAGRLLVGILLGIPLGVWGLSALPEAWVTATLGAVLVLTGLYNLSARAGSRPGPPPGVRWAYAYGLAGGILSGAYNTGGPPVVIYGVQQRWPPDKFRGTIQGCFLPAMALKIAGHGLAGLWTPQVLLLTALSLPVVAAALWVGGRLSRHLSPARFARLVYGGLAVLGLTLLAGALR